MSVARLLGVTLVKESQIVYIYLLTLSHVITISYIARTIGRHTLVFVWPDTLTRIRFRRVSNTLLKSLKPFIRFSLESMKNCNLSRFRLTSILRHSHWLSSNLKWFKRLSKTLAQCSPAFGPRLQVLVPLKCMVFESFFAGTAYITLV